MPPVSPITRTCSARASAWFHFYARNPRDLDLGFYLVQGLAPRGLSSELDRELNQRLLAALQPCKDALLSLGLDEAMAQVENTALFAHGIGLLLLQHTGRIRLFAQDAEPLFQRYLQHLLLRLDPQGAAIRAEGSFEPVAPDSQPDLFGP